MDKNLFPHLDWDTTTGWGYLPPTQEIENVVTYIRDEIKPKRMLEIGYYAGHSTSYFAHYLPDTEIVSCCPNHPKYRETYRGVEKAYPNVKVVPVKSPEIYEFYPDESFDFVFIDGAHTKRNVILDTAVALVLDTRYVLYDNANQSGVINGRTYFDHKLNFHKGWDYWSTHKGETKHNQIELYRKV